MNELELDPYDKSCLSGESLDSDGRIVVSLDNFTGRLILPIGVTLHRPSFSTPSPTPPSPTPASPLASLSPTLLPRWGATFTKICFSKALLYGGEGEQVNEQVEEMEEKSIEGASEERISRKRKRRIKRDSAEDRESSSGLLGSVTEFDLTTGTFKTRSSWSGSPLAWHASVYLESSGHLVVFGGVTESGEVTAEAKVFDCDINLWYPLTTTGSSPMSLMGHSMCLMENESSIYLFGGLQDGVKETNELFSLDTKSWRWSRIRCEGKLPKARAFHTANKVREDTMVVVGGRNGDAVFGDVHVLQVTASNSLERKKWEWSTPIITGVPFRPRCGHQTVSCNFDKPNMLLVFGGWDPQMTMGDAGEDDKDNNAKGIFEDALLLDVDKLHWMNAREKFYNATKLGPLSGHSAVVSPVGDVDKLWLTVVGGQVAVDNDTGRSILSNKVQHVPLFDTPHDSPALTMNRIHQSTTPQSPISSTSSPPRSVLLNSPTSTLKRKEKRGEEEKIEEQSGERPSKKTRNGTSVRGKNNKVCAKRDTVPILDLLKKIN